MPRKAKKKVVDETKITSVSLLWDNIKTMPDVHQKNMSSRHVDDMFTISAEFLMSVSPDYYEYLSYKLKYLYDFMYNNSAKNIN